MSMESDYSTVFDAEMFDLYDLPLDEGVEMFDLYDLPLDEDACEIALFDAPSAKKKTKKKKKRSKNSYSSNSFRLTMKNGKRFVYTCKEEYENKNERQTLLKQTMINLGIREGTSCDKEGFLFGGLQLNDLELNALFSACNNEWCFYFCKFYLLEKLISTDEITLQQWQRHEKNATLKRPKVEDSRKLERTNKDFTLFESHFWAKTSADVALAILGSIGKLQGTGVVEEKMETLCQSDFSGPYGKARCAIAKQLRDTGRSELMKVFLISQLDQLYTKKRHRSEGQEEKLAGPSKVAEGPEKKRIKAVVLRAAQEDSDDSRRENSPPSSAENSPRDEEVQKVKEEKVGEPKPVDRFYGFEDEIKSMREFAPDLTIEAAVKLLKGADGDGDAALNTYFNAGDGPHWSRVLSNARGDGHSSYLVQEKKEVTVTIPSTVSVPKNPRRNASAETLDRVNDDGKFYRGPERIDAVKEGWRTRKEPLPFNRRTWLLVLLFVIVTILLKLFALWLFSAFPSLQFNVNLGSHLGPATIIALLIAWQCVCRRPSKWRERCLVVSYVFLAVWVNPTFSPSLAGMLLYSVCTLWLPRKKPVQRVFFCCCLLGVSGLMTTVYIILYGSDFVVIVSLHVKMVFSILSVYVEQRSTLLQGRTLRVAQIWCAPIRDLFFCLTVPVGIYVLCTGG